MRKNLCLTSALQSSELLVFIEEACMVDTVLFDMDGTLLDTLADLSASVNYALKRAGLPLVSQDQVRAAAGYASVYLIDELTEHRFDVDSEEFKAVWQDFSDHYAAHHNDATRPYPGIMEALAGLAERGCKMAVVSNKMHADTEALRELWFADYIPVGLGYMPSRPRKPAPDMAWAALEELGSKPEHAIYVGDSDPDAQIAHASGCFGVCCTWGFRTREQLEQEHPDRIIDTPEELLAIYDQLNASA